MSGTLLAGSDADAGASDTPFPLFKEGLSYQSQLLARLTQNDYMSRIADTGIAPAQAYVLGELWLHEPQSQVELARRLDIGKATIGQTLARLERAGLVRRQRVDIDRRRIMVHLTERGRRLRDPLGRAVIEQDAMLQDTLGEATVAELAEILRNVNERLCEALSRNSPDPIG